MLLRTRSDGIVVNPEGDAAPFIRRHRLSPEAIAYQARRKPSVPIQMPDLTDHAAVADWRAETNALWGEDNDPQVPHRRELVGGVACLIADPPTTVSSSRTPGTPVTSGPPTMSRPPTPIQPMTAPETPITAPETPIVVYAHGGGYVLGSAAVAIPITARLAASSLRVVSVDYRQPPEHPFPAALDDVLAVYLALAARDTPVAFAGDSAGGALALSAAVMATAQGVRPAAVALFSPLLDHLPARRLDDAGSDTDDRQGQELLSAYVGEADPADPRLSPLRAELADLPPLLVQAAAVEPLAAQAVELHDRAAAAGIEIKLDLWEHMWHTWHYHDLPEADQALAEAVAFLTAQLGPRVGRSVH